MYLIETYEEALGLLFFWFFGGFFCNLSAMFVVMVIKNCKGMLSYKKEKYHDNMGNSSGFICHADNIFCAQKNVSLAIQISHPSSLGSVCTQTVVSLR